MPANIGQGLVRRGIDKLAVRKHLPSLSEDADGTVGRLLACRRRRADYRVPRSAGRRALWRGGRVAEGARLESVYTGNRIVGSNPTPSATLYSHLRCVTGFMIDRWRSAG